MKRNWKITTISILLLGLIVYGTYITIRIFTSNTLYTPTVDTKSYFEFEKEYKKRTDVLESAAYQKGVQDYNQGLQKKAKGIDYSAEAEEMINDLPKNGHLGIPNVLYDDSYEKGYHDAQQKEKDEK